MRTTMRETTQLPWLQMLTRLYPAVTAQAAYSRKLHETFVAASTHWQTFVRARLRADLHLMRELGKARTPRQRWTVSARFWEKAAADYLQEYAAMARLAVDFVPRDPSTAEEDVPVQPATRARLPRAA